jgi:hypothetical protein
LKTLKTTAESVDEAQPRGLERELRVDVEVVHVVRDILQNLVRRGALSGLGVVRHGALVDVIEACKRGCECCSCTSESGARVGAGTGAGAKAGVADKSPMRFR